jgi:hypothetical protein
MDATARVFKRIGCPAFFRVWRRIAERLDTVQEQAAIQEHIQHPRPWALQQSSPAPVEAVTVRVAPSQCSAGNATDALRLKPQVEGGLGPHGQWAANVRLEGAGRVSSMLAGPSGLRDKVLLQQAVAMEAGKGYALKVLK